jgi:hypothetical protein
MTTDDPSTLEADADRAAAERRFADARVLLTALTKARPDHFDGWLKLSAMARASGDAAGALAATVGALSVQPLNFTALLMKATLLQALGEDAGEAYGHALAQAPEVVPPPVVPALAAARERYAAWQNGRATALRHAVEAVTPLTASLERFITNTVRLTEADRAGPTHYCYPDLPEIPFHPRGTFPWLDALEAATAQITEDFKAVVAAEAAELVPYVSYAADMPMPQWTALNNSRDWTAIHLIRNGVVVEANARHCPQVMALLAAIPQPVIAGASPNAMFSLLAPGAHIPPHTGIANTRLVCHLPLIVPKGCWFRVGDERREWEVGTAWVFDDTIEHEALNPSADLRVILIVDVWTPALTPAAQAGIAAIIADDGGMTG